MEGLVNRSLPVETYRNKKVFVTGHTGFKGSWLLAILKTLKAQVKGFALEPVASENLYDILNDDKDNCQSIIHDIRDKEKLKREILSFRPDFIFHLAAQPFRYRLISCF